MYKLIPDENMVHSYHRDRYGYDYYASLGDQSYYTEHNINWNDHTTGNWKKEESIREGYRRYDRMSTSEWFQKSHGHNKQLRRRLQFQCKP